MTSVLSVFSVWDLWNILESERVKRRAHNVKVAEHERAVMAFWAKSVSEAPETSPAPDQSEDPAAVA